jgi:hypothetical protein
MNRAWKLATGVSRRHFLALSAAFGVIGMVGCKNTWGNKNPLKMRSQIGEDPSDPDTVTTIGAKTTVSNTEPLTVNGVSLVYNLAGTGSSPPPSGYRTMLEENLKRRKRDQAINTKQFLDNPAKTTSLVLVSALIPPGARKGERIDVQITLPDDSKTISLQGGKLFPADLLTSDTTANVHSQIHNGNAAAPSGRMLLGDRWAEAASDPEHTLVAGNFVADGSKPVQDLDSEGRPSYRAAMISGGGVVTGNRPYYLLLNNNDKNTRIAAGIAERLNSTFHTTDDPKLKVAEAKDKELVLLNVPYAYRHNHYRFLLVVRQVPFMPVSATSAYRQKLEEELLDPATTLAAAVKLEALGGDCRRSLKVGLESPSPWVRFAAAESLAYLGQTDGVNELARLAEDHPALRAQCLKALASIEDALSTDHLVDMLSSNDVELRQGAYIALRLADERHPSINGTVMGKSYWLHRLAPEASPAVHLSTTGRSEVLLFGDVKLRGPIPPMSISNDFTVSWQVGQPTARVTRIVKGSEDAEVREARCAPNLASVLGAMASLGGGYSEAIELIRKTARADVLAASLVVDAIPREMSIQQLAGYSKTDPTLAKANQEIAKVGAVRPSVDANGFDLPTAQDLQIQPAGAPLTRPPLNRDPGRLFGPKRAAEAPPILDPAVVPAGGQSGQ